MEIIAELRADMRRLIGEMQAEFRANLDVLRKDNESLRELNFELEQLASEVALIRTVRR